MYGRMRSLRWLSLLPLLACSEDPIQPARAPAASVAQAVAASGPLVSTRVEIPSGMRSTPFDVERQLRIPANFSIAVYARVPNARFMAVAPNGDLLVSQPSRGKVLLVRPNGGGSPIVSEFVAGLRLPHDIVFHTIGGTTYLYISEAHQINRYVYQTGDRTARGRQIVVSGLPYRGTLRYRYNHSLKNIALDLNHNLYVMIASSCDACLEDTRSNPLRGAIYQYDANGGNRRLFAQGLRNAEGLAFVPGTNELWVVANQRNSIAYPYNDGSGNYGRILRWYTDNHPPEQFTRVRSGGNYGWPFCNPNPDTPSGYNTMPFDRDYTFNRDGHVNCGAMDRITKGIQAHSAPLGLTFLQGTNFPAAYRQGAVVALHGSGQPRSRRTGAKLIYFPWDEVNHRPDAPVDLVSGWLTGESYWGRPVDAAVDRRGHLFISDDHSGTIYELFPTP